MATFDERSLTTMKSTGILARSMAALGLVFLLATAGPLRADLEIPGITGVAKQFPTKDNDPLSFFLTFEADKSIAPGIRFYPAMRIVFADETWIDGRGECFPTGMRSGIKAGGGVSSIHPTGPVPPVKLIEIVATFGEPNKFFLPEEFGRQIPPLDDKTLAILKRAGGFVISIPVVPAK
ncbi:MAG: hypothetical protein K8R23_14205 [Chthoniobacter sp.]|nr:hypothetical protein [Chthoniobacter sp.]